MYQLVTIIGNVGREPELRYTPQGVAVCDFSVAVNKVTGKGEARNTKTTWFKVTTWRERAETASKYVKKGMKLMVVGEVETEAYLDKQGQPQAQLKLTASDFKFLDSRQDGAGEGQAQRGGSDNRDTGDDVADDQIPF